MTEQEAWAAYFAARDAHRPVSAALETARYALRDAREAHWQKRAALEHAIEAREKAAVDVSQKQFAFTLAEVNENEARRLTDLAYDLAKETEREEEAKL